MATVSASKTTGKSRVTRTYRFEGNADAGTLTITMTRHLRRGDVAVTETYDLEEDHTEWFPARTFLLHKQSDGEVYGVTLTPAGQSCTCTGGSVHGRCKHADAIRHLHDRGGLLGMADREAMAVAHG